MAQSSAKLKRACSTSEEDPRPPGRQHDAKFAEFGRGEFAIRADILSKALSERDYLLESRFSGADILMGHSCFMATHMGLIGDLPVLETYFERLQQRPAHQRVYGN